MDMNQSKQGQTLRLSLGDREIGAVSVERGLSLLGASAGLLYFLRRPSLTSFAAAIAGGALLAKGLTGRPALISPPSGPQARDRSGYGPMPMRAQHHRQPLAVRQSITVERPIEEVYGFWRNLENLPKFMKHVESVRVTGDLSHWVVKLAPAMVFEWDARISSDVENELIAWQTLPGAPVDHTGTVRFHPTGDRRGTVIEVNLAYYPPAGMVGEAIAKLEKSITDQQIKEDIRRFKQVVEASEVPTIAGQPHGA
jgi:uncharacterized membrane protein